MWIVILIIVILVVIFLYNDKVKTSKVNNSKVKEIEEELIQRLHQLYLKSINTLQSKETINDLSIEIYKLAFYKLGRIPFDFSQFQIEPQKLTQQLNYLSVYKSLSEAICKTSNYIYANKHISKQMETRKTFEVLVDQITQQIKEIK